MDRIPPTRLSRLLAGWAALPEGSMPERLAAALAELARDGDVPPGTVLPSQRSLAATLGVSRSTVTEAYALLRESGRLDSRRGSGSMLRGSATVGDTVLDGRLATFDERTGGELDLSSGALDGLEIVAATAGELRAEELLPLLREDGYLPYGLPELREAIAEAYRRTGVPTCASEILVTAGSQQAVWLIAQAFVGPGDTVAVEDPTYRGALEVFRGRRARLVPVAAESVTEALDRVTKGGRPRLVYLQPTVHNPTGRTTEEAERRRLRELLTARGLSTVEDEASAELLLDRDDAPRPLGSAMMVGTLSKLFWGGLRIGWIRASPELIARLAEIKKSVDLGCSVLDQVVATRMLRSAPAARTQRRSALRRRLESLEALLRREAPSWTWPRPSGGSALWVRVPGIDTAALAQVARREGVVTVPGPSFSAVEGFRDRLRLPFGRLDPSAEEGVRRLVRIAERM